MSNDFGRRMWTAAGEGTVPVLMPADSLFAGQWHLKNSGQTGGTAGIDLNVTGLWDDYSGAGVAVGVYDDGIDYAHADLDGSYDASRHLVIGGVAYDARPANTGSYRAGGDTHGDRKSTRLNSSHANISY